SFSYNPRMPYKTSLVLSVFLLFVTLVAVGAPSAFAQRSRFTARQVIEIIQKEIGAPRDPETVDTFKTGDPDTPVTGIATTFLATFDVLKRAAASGKNLVITHEPTFYNHRDETALFQSDPVFREKATFIRDHHLIVWRFH